MLCKCWSRMRCTLSRAMSRVRLGQYTLWVLLAEGHRCYSTQIVGTQNHDTMPVHALLVKAGQRKSQDPDYNSCNHPGSPSSAQPCKSTCLLADKIHDSARAFAHMMQGSVTNRMRTVVSLAWQTCQKIRHLSD